MREARDIKVMITQEGTRAVVENRNGEEFIAIDTGELPLSEDSRDDALLHTSSYQLYFLINRPSINHTDKQGSQYVKISI